jgi:hypothetical protein
MFIAVLYDVCTQFPTFSRPPPLAASWVLANSFENVTLFHREAWMRIATEIKHNIERLLKQMESQILSDVTVFVKDN